MIDTNPLSPTPGTAPSRGYGLERRARRAYSDLMERREEEKRRQERQARRQFQESLARELRDTLDVEWTPGQLPENHGEPFDLDGIHLGFPDPLSGNAWELHAFGKCPGCGALTPARNLSYNARTEEYGHGLDSLGQWLAADSPTPHCHVCRYATELGPEPPEEVMDSEPGPDDSDAEVDDLHERHAHD